MHLLTSPNYHTAVTVFGGGALHLGHTLVCMDGWDAEQALALIERYRVTNTHMVPDPVQADARAAGGDPAPLRPVVDALAAPRRGAVPGRASSGRCSTGGGPCIYEYYAATEGGGTMATPQDWLAHPGTVGTAWPVSEIMIADDDGNSCPPGEPGTVYMKMDMTDFEYKGDPAKTAASRLHGFFTVGDIGYLDEDGFLFLCDRKSDMIISGGANIYPAEIEAEIIMHPKVADVAVFGIPDDDWGEQVKAVVEPLPGAEPGDELAAEILASLEGRLAKMKWPRSIDFIDELPRDPSGKLLKRRLRDPYWAGPGQGHLTEPGSIPWR